MMLKPPMNELLAKVPSRYMLVNIVAQRARRIASEAESAGEPLDDKPVSIAIREVAEGKLDEEIRQDEAEAAEEIRQEEEENV